ncbi:hypothetical protein A8F17_31530 [Burkholderia cenocepacia]|uniref:BRO-N domain-containing protein n=1 Tax=Burkholderia cenocepacia TaxID=95486 RepID=UPI0009822231|nr:hypothetical protein A8F17_31530 [Burkholderia cenocepacia]ONY02288.1 hypothetical protein A8F20_15825 [Burkholderia cenocepacia]
MNNGLLSFDHDGATIRTLTVEGEPYFVARDVAEILGYSNYRDAIARHCKRRFHKDWSARRRVFQQIRQQPSLRNAP